MGQLQTQKLKPVHSYQTAKYGPGVGVFSLRQVRMDNVVCVCEQVPGILSLAEARRGAKAD